jgi:hypothetical protein
MVLSPIYGPYGQTLGHMEDAIIMMIIDPSRAMEILLSHVYVSRSRGTIQRYDDTYDTYDTYDTTIHTIEISSRIERIRWMPS